LAATNLQRKFAPFEIKDLIGYGNGPTECLWIISEAAQAGASGSDETTARSSNAGRMGLFRRSAASPSGANRDCRRGSAGRAIGGKDGLRWQCRPGQDVPRLSAAQPFTSTKNRGRETGPLTSLRPDAPRGCGSTDRNRPLPKPGYWPVLCFSGLI
jgi:hypothetical protein